MVSIDRKVRRQTMFSLSRFQSLSALAISEVVHARQASIAAPVTQRAAPSVRRLVGISILGVALALGALFTGHSVASAQNCGTAFFWGFCLPSDSTMGG